MGSTTVLVTGGAGFIGQHLCEALLNSGYEVRILDALIEQVHNGRAPVRSDAELIVGDVRDEVVIDRALRGVDAVVHLAAEVGVGQSMYEIDRYVSVNDRGTAVLLQAMLKRSIRRILIASSMSIYGEGLYCNADGELVEDACRNVAALSGWDPVDSRGRPLMPVATPEWKRPSLASVYAITKYTQERLVLTVAEAYGFDAVALRLWNAFGPGQALGNPYTGVLAIFASRLLNRQPPLIFEDGRQQRDFVDVRDVAQAFVRALTVKAAAGGVFNIGSGVCTTVREVAERLSGAMGRKRIRPLILGKHRKGDVRHNVPDIGRAREVLGYAPRYTLDDGLPELVDWLRGQQPPDHVPHARRELERRGLVA